MENLRLPLEEGDTVVASFPYRDTIFVISHFGHIWQFVVEDLNDLPAFRRIS